MILHNEEWRARIWSRCHCKGNSRSQTLWNRVHWYYTTWRYINVAFERNLKTSCRISPTYVRRLEYLPTTVSLLFTAIQTHSDRRTDCSLFETRQSRPRLCMSQYSMRKTNRSSGRSVRSIGLIVRLSSTSIVYLFKIYFKMKINRNCETF